MFCPHCGNRNSAGQKFCRACGLGLEKIAQSLAEQLPARVDEGLQERPERFERLGVAALSVFGVGVLGFILYGIVYKLMITQGKILAGLVSLGVIVLIGCGLLSVVLFAKANEAREAAAKRRLHEAPELNLEGATKELLPEAEPAPLFSVTEPTTELLAVGKRSGAREV